MTPSATVDPAVGPAASAASAAHVAPADASAVPAKPSEPAGLDPVGQPTPAGVLSGRAQIDDLDARILALISERVHTAAKIQASRIAEGGRRLDLKRETEIIARYREALGRPGVNVAMSVLELCRGKV